MTDEERAQRMDELREELKYLRAGVHYPPKKEKPRGE